jgi:RAC serine/threonine-protein kinase
MSVREGYLIKKGEVVKNWKTRWFILGSQTLSYYKSENQVTKVLGVIRLNEVFSVNFAGQKKKGRKVIEVSTPRRTYYMHTLNENEEELWFQAIRQQVDFATGNATTTTKTETTEDKKIGFDDFECLNIIGEGSFGKVVQVRMKATGDIFAMKVLNKKNIVERGEVEHTIAERNILMKVEHPFLMKLHYAFQSAEKLYLVMDFVNGGELFYHLQQTRRFDLNRTRFYTAEIVLALEHLHDMGIIYRDLKPENLLLDSDGHIKMTDFGLSKEGLEGYDAKTKTFCGTPEYLAPEVLDGLEYNKGVDWWSLGTLIFEMLTGLPPFYDEDIQRMYTKKMTTDVAIPSYVDSQAADLITKFLIKDPNDRLSHPEDIKGHPFFATINWEHLFQKKITPPYVPDVNSLESVDMIDKGFINMDVNRELANEGNSQITIADFTYSPNQS